MGRNHAAKDPGLPTHRVVHDLHTAHWIILALISLLPASVTATLISFMGEHSVSFLGMIFVLCFGVISLMVLALLGHPQKAAYDQRKPTIGTQNAMPRSHYRAFAIGSSFTGTDQPPMRSALLTPNRRGCEDDAGLSTDC